MLLDDFYAIKIFSKISRMDRRALYIYYSGSDIFPLILFYKMAEKDSCSSSKSNWCHKYL